MDASFIQGRITATQAQIILYEGAITALVTDGIESYTLDTGQSVQKVTKLDLDKLQTQLNSLYNRCATLQARLTGSGTVTGVPAW